MLKINSIKIERFKNLSSVTMALDDINLLIGGNNAGKSSVIQAVHFAVATLRSARMNGKSSNRPATTLGTDQFNYLPTQELMRMHHRFPMTQNAGPRFTFNFDTEDQTNQIFSLNLYRGKNANVALSFSRNSPFFERASNLLRPFSVYVPGLAGVPLSEERRANSIVQSGIAQGDSNLFLRNVLHRLEEDPAKKRALILLMRDIFPNFFVSTSFDEDINQYISADIRLDGTSTPLELAGTGCLQALQLAAYVILYEPELLLLDEPDAHLHPGNQKRLVQLLFKLAENSGTQILLASHSRHVFDSINNNPLGTIHWLRQGRLVEDEDVDLGLLLDLGALDEFEEIKQDEPKVLVFSEDEKGEKLHTLLSANGWDLSKVRFITYNGVDNLEATKIVVQEFLDLNEANRALIYRDGDGMTPAERQWATDRYQKALPERAEIYISERTDIEHHFCAPEHIADLAEIELQEAEEILDHVIAQNQGRLSAKFAQKRSDLKFKILRNFNDRESTENIVGDNLSFDYALGKILLPKLTDEIRLREIQLATLVRESDGLFVQQLQEFEFPE
ncbi:AAA family ATPase [Aurantiacibacter sp. MUD11]|uniref:AAA family ATPase n=1 Tax=Aurantiacibacter sp. MUD11 TaxID=3003265 RepID=UPI0022AA1E70|nr:AAA family ATPase [Aurantiacibacter sp. MUD11]WAT18000.1 AAA family ATPase [Aurantiacibacter sp. MUD11]